jgi:hypothetical protein
MLRRLQLAKFVVQLQEDVLRDFLRSLPIAEEMHCQAEYPRLMLPHDGCEIVPCTRDGLGRLRRIRPLP